MKETYQLRAGEWVRYHGGTASYRVESDVTVKTGQEEVKLIEER